ncbi:MAG: ABC transporter permease, partial [Acidobacteriota bacterium]
MQNIIRDLRLSARGLIRSPVLAATIVLTVGLGIGGTVAVFSIVHTVLIKPLPYAEPGQLLRIYHDYPPNRWPLSVADWLAIQEQQTMFTSVAAYRNRSVTYSEDDRAERIRAKYVTAGYFSLLGMVPLQGRLFRAADDVPGAAPTVVVGNAFWQNELGGDPSRVGRPIRLDGIDRTVIGVLPASTGPLEKQIDVFPIAQLEPPRRKGPFFLTILGRLKSGVAPDVAAAELRAIEERIFSIWQASWPNPTSTYGIMPLGEFVAGDVRTKLTILLSAVAFVLLIASTNAANLLVARGAQRRRELAVRAALGASRGRLVRELLTESGLLAFAGSGLGIGLAALVIHVLRGVGPEVIPRAQEMALTGPVLGFAAVVTMGSALLFVLVPSIQATRADHEEALRAGGRGSGESQGTQRFRRALVMSEFAVAVPLLIGAGLLLTSFARLQSVNPGVAVE